MAGPDKMPSAAPSEKAKSAKAKFWDAFYGGCYEELPGVIEALTAAYLENPRDAETTAHIGFSHVWFLSEGAPEKASATIPNNLVLARKYFAGAVRLSPDERAMRSSPSADIPISWRPSRGGLSSTCSRQATS